MGRGSKKYRKPSEDITVYTKDVECFGNDAINTWTFTKFPFELLIVEDIEDGTFVATISLVGAEPAWRGDGYTTINQALQGLQAQCKAFSEDIAWWRTL